VWSSSIENWEKLRKINALSERKNENKNSMIAKKFLFVNKQERIGNFLTYFSFEPKINRGPEIFHFPLENFNFF
jgi:hypothetical protein